MAPRTILGALFATAGISCSPRAQPPAPLPPQGVDVATVAPSPAPSPGLAERGAEADPAAPPGPPDGAVLPQGDTCGLRATLRELPPKDGFARYTLTLTNGSKKPVSLVVPGDGSEAGWRTPAITWIATANGQPATRAEGGRCGMMNPIAASEIFTLAPGASREINEWLGFPSFVPGTYDLRLRYRNDPALQSRKAGAAPDAAQKIAQSSPCDITSNAIKTSIKRP